MIGNLIRLAAVSAFALSIASGPLAAQEALGDWDTNEDGGIIHYAAWDSDGDSLIRESEFLSGLYSAYDADADGKLVEDELGAFEDDAYFQM